MIVEEERVAVERKSLKQEREFLGQQIRIGDRYERLLSNSDFKDMLQDLEDTLKIHQSQLEVLDIDLLEANSPFKINRISMVRKIHLERMLQLKQALRRPAQIVAMAEEAKNRLDTLTKREKELL
jgi:hypothetical protein